MPAEVRIRRTCPRSGPPSVRSGANAGGAGSSKSYSRTLPVGALRSWATLIATIRTIRDAGHEKSRHLAGCTDQCTRAAGNASSRIAVAVVARARPTRLELAQPAPDDLQRLVEGAVQPLQGGIGVPVRLAPDLLGHPQRVLADLLRPRLR